MKPLDPVVIIFLAWMGAIIAAAGLSFLLKEFSFDRRTERRHERDWKHLQKHCKTFGVACPNRRFSDALSDLNYYEVPGP
jgi:hypothetical protein